MKRQIRRGVFETNSSSTHSLTICLKSDYDKWESEELLLFKGWDWGYPEDKKPEKNHFYTKEEAIAFEKANKYPPDEDFNWDDEDEVMDMLHDNGWFDSDYYRNNYCNKYETFEEDLIMPNGEGIVAFGYYGYDG